MNQATHQQLRRATLRSAVLACSCIFASLHAQPSAPLPNALPPEPEYAVPTRLDRAGRVLVPVSVNGQGPFRFILDTGANRAVLSNRVLQVLQVAISDANPAVAVHGVTGSAMLPAVRIAELRVGDLVLARDQSVPVLSQAVLSNADGILGIEGLSGARIDIDFVADSVTIMKSTGRQRASPKFLTIDASLRHGGLIMVPGRVGKVRVKAIIDTGAERTLGNNALREALLFAPQVTGAEAVTRVFGATSEVREGTSFITPTIFLGEVEVRDLEVTFGDLHVFRIWGLEREPAILIGMDLLGTVQRLVIDYRRRELQLKP